MLKHESMSQLVNEPMSQLVNCSRGDARVEGNENDDGNGTCGHKNGGDHG